MDGKEEGNEEGGERGAQKGGKCKQSFRDFTFIAVVPGHGAESVLRTASAPGGLFNRWTDL